LHLGDALEVLKQLPDNSIDTVITDPPYGLSQHSEKTIREVLGKWLNGEEDYVPKKKGFMGKAWDAFVPPPALWKEVYRVMKPGGTILVFAGARTQDLMAMSLRLAGFEIKDTLMWLYGSGFPKAYDIAKGVESKIKQGSANWSDWKNLDGTYYKQKTGYVKLQAKQGYRSDYSGVRSKDIFLTTEEAKQWDGYKSHSLKPAYEPIIMAIKPNEGSYAENALKWNVAGLNIDGARIGVSKQDVEEVKRKANKKPTTNKIIKGFGNNTFKQGNWDISNGRFPANILLDEEAAKMLDEQSGESKSQCSARGGVTNNKIYGKFDLPTRYMCGYDDSGGASRFFYVAKASAKERNMGLSEDLKNIHPTVKPLKLLEYLVKLTSMPNENQIYLDPFLGSGTTAMACEKLNRKWIGIEINEEYIEIAKKRINAIIKQFKQINKQDYKMPLFRSEVK